MQNWDFLSVSLRLYFQVVSNSQKDFAVFKCYSSWTSQFFPVHDTMESWVFWKQAWAILLKFSQFTKELGNWDFWSVPYTPLLSLEPSSYIKKMRWGDKQRISQKKKWFHSFPSSQFCSTYSVFALAWVCRTNYILELFNILLSEGWLTKNCPTISISNKCDQ